MKKLLVLTIVLIMALSLAACGGKTDPASSGNGKTDPGASQQEPSSTPGAVDTSTLNGFLAQFGLTESDLKPAEHFASFDYRVTKNKSYQGTVTVNMDWGDLENDGAQKKAAVSKWMKQVYDRLLAVSDDGKAYKPYTTEEFIFDDGVLVAQWAIYYKETNHWFTLSCEGGSIAYFTIAFN